MPTSSLAVTLPPYLIYSVLVTILVARCARPVHNSVAPDPLAWSDLVFVIASLAFVLVARAPFFCLAGDLHPDEAQYGANAIMARSGWLNWDTLDSGSSGPLNSMIHAWPLPLGFDVTITTVHLTSALLACLLALLVYLVLRVEFDRTTSYLFASPLVLALGATTNTEVVQAASLYLPLVLCTFGILATTVVLHRPSPVLAASGAFSLGLILLAKLQVAPLGLLVGLTLLIAHSKWGTTPRARFGRALLLVVAALLPLTVSLVDLVSRGHLQDFVQETLVYSSAYTVSRPLLNPYKWLLIALHVPMLGAVVVFYGLVIAVAGVTWLRDWRGSRRFTWFSLAVVVVGIAAMISPGRTYPYYCLFLVPTLPLLAAALVREVLSRQPQRGRWIVNSPACWAGGVAALLFPVAAYEGTQHIAFEGQGALMAAGLRFRSPQILKALEPGPNDTLIVFGYMPGYYIASGMASGTRETWSETILEERPGSDREGYRRRFLREMDQAGPALIIDAVTYTSHVYKDPADHGPATFPALAERLKRDYLKVSRGSVAEGCPETYMLRSRVAAIQSRQVTIASVTASGTLQDEYGTYGAEHLTDRDVLESCIDRWLAPAATPADVRLYLATPEPIARVALLNTRGRWRGSRNGRYSYIDNVAAYHAAETAWVRLMRGDTVIAERQVRVDSYPYWTDVEFDGAGGPADAVSIYLPDWRGAGPGLNEVAVYRARTAYLE